MSGSRLCYAEGLEQQRSKRGDVAAAGDAHRIGNDALQILGDDVALIDLGGGHDVDGQAATAAASRASCSTMARRRVSITCSILADSTCEMALMEAHKVAPTAFPLARLLTTNIFRLMSYRAQMSRYVQAKVLEACSTAPIHRPKHRERGSPESRHTSERCPIIA